MAYANASLSALLVNTSQTAGFEYKINSGSWLFVGRGTGARISINFSSDKLYLRQTSGDLSTTTVEITADSLPNVSAVEGSAAFSLTQALTALPKPGSIECGGGILGGPLNSGATANSTWCHAISAWGPFSRVKLVFGNASASSETVDLFSVAPSSSIYPSGINNIAQPQGGGVFGAVQSAFAVAAGTSARVPSYIPSAWLDCRSVARAAGELDNGIYELLLARVYFQTGNTNSQYMSLNAAMGGSGWDSVNEGFTLQFGRAPTGDKVTTPGSLTSLTREATNPIVMVHGAIFDYDQKMYSILTPGDSIWDGALDGVTNRCPFTFKAIARVRRTGKMVSYINGGIASSTAAEINTRGKALIDVYAPDLIIIASYTINSATATQADWDAQWLLFKDLAKYQLSKGKQVLFVTPLPNNSFTSTINGYRLIQRQRVISSGFPYVDIEAATVDIADGRGRWLAGLTFDGTHPNPAGHEAIASPTQVSVNALTP